MSTVEHLEQVLTDLTTNRTRLQEQIDGSKVQLEVNVVQLARFDTLIATVRHSLGDNHAIAGIDAIKNAAPEDQPAPLDSAGAGNQIAPAPAG